VTPSNIAFIGLGGMGSPMAQHLAANLSFSVKAWNRTQQNRPFVDRARAGGVEVVSTIQTAVTSADFIFTCVGDISDVESVIFGEGGIVHHARQGAIVIDFSTIGPQAARDIAQKLQPYNLHFLDAPVSGGDIGAQQGTLTIMVGGDRTDFDRVLPSFETIGKKIVHCGVVGSGQAIKLCNQVLCGINAIAFTEAILLAQQLGVDPHLTIDVCSTGAGGSWALANLAAKAVNGDFQPGFIVKHILKDLRLVDENLQQLDLPGVSLANRLFETVRDLDGAEQGTQALIRAYLDRRHSAIDTSTSDNVV
jgi:3-hydroxyisobutyrate dehydrogenase